MVVLGFIGLSEVVSPLRAATPFETTASGSARQFELTCGTCPNPVTVVSGHQDGGPGETSATVDFAMPGTLSYFATATLTRPTSLPHLGAGDIRPNSGHVSGDRIDDDPLKRPDMKYEGKVNVTLNAQRVA